MKKDCKKCAFANRYYDKDGNEALLICSAGESLEDAGPLFLSEVSDFDPRLCIMFKKTER